MATSPRPGLITAAQFLEIDFGPDIKAELDNGVIRVVRNMAGGSYRNSRIQMNIGAILWTALKGSKCHVHGSDMAILIDDYSVRYPDLSVFCGKQDEAFDEIKAANDPVMIVEILSPSTALLDQGLKLDEYRAIPSVQAVLLVDPKAECVRVLSRTGPNAWTDEMHGDDEAISIAGLNIEIPLTDIFAR
jgi:Uma2 family endonuclease